MSDDRQNDECDDDERNRYVIVQILPQATEEAVGKYAVPVLTCPHCKRRLVARDNNGIAYKAKCGWPDCGRVFLVKGRKGACGGLRKVGK